MAQYLGEVTAVKKIGSKATYNEYSVDTSKGPIYTRNDEVLSLKEGDELYITKHGKFLKGL